MKSRRIIGYDVIRIFSAFVVVAYHFASTASAKNGWASFPYFFNYQGKSWGGTAVGLFFILSGAAIAMTHDFELNRRNILQFYWTRAKKLYPMFWMAFSYIYIQNVVMNHSFFYFGKPWLLLLSFFGVDGYFNYMGRTYYLIGEWFLGAIILVYLLYPVILFCFHRMRYVTLAVLILLAYLNQLNVFGLKIPFQQNILTCCLLFYAGMLFEQIRLKITQYSWIFGPVSIAGMIYLLVQPTDIPIELGTLIMSFVMFVALFCIGSWLSLAGPAQYAAVGLSGLTYPVFLLQHQIINWVCRNFAEFSLTQVQEFWLLVMVFILTLVYAWILKMISLKLSGRLVLRKRGA